MEETNDARPPPTPSFHYKMRIQSLESKVALLGGGVDGGELVEVLQEREEECAAQRAHIAELEQKLRVAGKTLVTSERRAKVLEASLAEARASLDAARADGATASAERAEARAEGDAARAEACLLYTSPSPRDGLLSRMPSSA